MGSGSGRCGRSCLRRSGLEGWCGEEAAVCEGVAGGLRGAKRSGFTRPRRAATRCGSLSRSDSGGLMNPPGYRSMLRGKVEGSRFELRLELVRYAQEHGIREAARAFRASRNTVRLWLRRYEAGEPGRWWSGAVRRSGSCTRRLGWKRSGLWRRGVWCRALGRGGSRRRLGSRRARTRLGGFSRSGA